MSWNADDGMQQLVDYCVEGKCTCYYAKSIAIHWLEKQEQYPGCSRKESDEIKIKLDELQNNSEVSDPKLLFKGCGKMINTGVPPMTQNCCKPCLDLYEGAVPEYLLCKECQTKFALQKGDEQND